MMAGIKENMQTQRYLAFSQRISNDFNVVAIDHCYAKPWSLHPDSSNARPIKKLFMEKTVASPVVDRNREEDIDVDGEEADPITLYDVPKARIMMTECERHTALFRSDHADLKEDWEDHFSAVRTTWSVQQNRIFAKIMKILQADRLARLSVAGSKNEPIQRRLQIDKAAKRVRFAFGNIGWDKTLTLWIHNLLLEKLRGQLLTSYLEVLQKLKEKIPSLIDRLLEDSSSKTGQFGGEAFSGLMKRNWDPVIGTINQQKLKKFPDSPIILLIHGAPVSATNPSNRKRNKLWQSQLASVGKVVNVAVANNPNSSISNCVANLITTTRSKILEMKSHFPGRHIVLIGWNIGALVAVHVSLVEVVNSVVCLGFPTMGISGNRGEVDDNIYSCKTPTLFVVGQHASATNLDCLEDLRERLRVETGLIQVGGADDQLRMIRAKKRRWGLTQAMVDRCIMEEMSEFLGGVFSQSMSYQDKPEAAVTVKKTYKKRKQADVVNAAGSQTVENLVKPPKKIRTMKVANVGTAGLGGHMYVSGTNQIVICFNRQKTVTQEKSGQPQPKAVIPPSSTHSFSDFGAVESAIITFTK